MTDTKPASTPAEVAGTGAKPSARRKFIGTAAAGATGPHADSVCAGKRRLPAPPAMLGRIRAV